MLTDALFIYRLNNDNEMNVYKSYSVHLSKETINIYYEYEPPVDTNVHDCM